MRAIDEEGGGTAFNVASAIYDATMQGADIINLSLSMLRHSDLIDDAVYFAENQGTYVFSSAGNTGTQGVTFPAYDSKVVAVASVDPLDVLSTFSAYGHSIAITAPGEAIYSALPGEKWGWWSGTSMACAVASGVGALAMSATLSGVQVKVDEIVENSSAPIGALNPGLEELIGRGRVDALAAVQEAIEEASH